MKVAGAVGVVTGGGGGLGGGVAQVLVEGGGKAAILDLESSGGAEPAGSLGPNALFVPTDVSDREQVPAAVNRAVESAGRVDLSVNAAADYATLVRCCMEVTLLNGERVRLDAATRVGS